MKKILGWMCIEMMQLILIPTNKTYITIKDFGVS